MNEQPTSRILGGMQALVTGASRGIGRAIAEGLLASGAAVAITARKPEALDIAAQELRGSRGEVLSIPCNQGNAADIDRLFEQLDRHGFAPDIAIINAATNPVMGPLLDTDLAAWQKILDVNLTGAWLTMRLAARRMLARGKGAIVVIASIAGIDPIVNLGAYSTSKAGLIGLSKAMAKELAPKVRVNVVAPGLIETRFSTALMEDRAGYERWLAQVPLGRHGQPQDVVGAALFLASNAADYITGQVLVVDGGGRV